MSTRVDAVMKAIRPGCRYRWCEAKECGCLGCVQHENYRLIRTGAVTHKLTKEEWSEWLRHNQSKTESF